jgi:hypothetical protein
VPGHLFSPAGVAQLVEHLICNQRVRGSNPFASSRNDFPELRAQFSGQGLQGGGQFEALCGRVSPGKLGRAGVRSRNPERFARDLFSISTP